MSSSGQEYELLRCGFTLFYERAQESLFHNKLVNFQNLLVLGTSCRVIILQSLKSITQLEDVMLLS